MSEQLDPKQRKSIASWAQFRLQRESFKRDQAEDDAGLPKGSWISVVIVLVAIVSVFVAAAYVNG